MAPGTRKDGVYLYARVFAKRSDTSNLTAYILLWEAFRDFPISFWIPGCYFVLELGSVFKCITNKHLEEIHDKVFLFMATLQVTRIMPDMMVPFVE